MTPTRRLVRQRMLVLAQRLGPQARVLEVGIAGDDPPGANREWFKAEVYETLDRDITLKPDHIVDLTDELLDPSLQHAFSLVICSQVLEHIWDIRMAVGMLWSLTAAGGHCILDVPFLYPPHADAREPDYWRMTPDALRRLCELAGFTVEEVIVDPEWLLVTVLARKGQAE